MTIHYNGRICEIVAYQHVKPGKGGAFVRVKLRDIQTGQVIDQTWKGEQKVEQAILRDRRFEYLYRDGNLYHFMDLETYEQTPLPPDMIGERSEFLKENMQVSITFSGDAVVGVKLPDFAELKVAETPPGDRGDTATGGAKPATLETGANIRVPLFVNVGDVIKVDTRSGAYVERV